MAADPPGFIPGQPELLRDRLAGRRVLVTGGTGFIGQAVLARLLEDAPKARVDVIIRPRGSCTAEDRLRALLRKPVFSSLRATVGDDALDAILAERVTAIEGALGATAPALPGDLDVVIHCAATVAFDPPIDEAFEINLQGTRSLYAAVRDSGSRPHLVHVSTAYVAGVRKGVVPEVALTHDVDWPAELDAALAARTEVERASRRPEALDRFMAEAAAEQRRAGPQAVAAEAERRRKAAVEARLIDHGRARATSLGWPDAYAFTKALGERATEELAREADLPLSVVRPAIVESALTWPYPGWIEGFKMADPIILAYGRGALPEFTGVADGVVELIPVDIVVNALLAVAAAPPPSVAAPQYLHVSSGARNPLSFQDLYEHVRAYFQDHPLPDPDNGEAIAVPEWVFPGQTKVERRLRSGERLLDLADRAIGRLPRSDRARDLLGSAHKARQKIEFIRRYADLFGKYTEAEVIYVDDATIALHRSLAPADRERLGFDSSTIDWGHYLEEVHCPSVTALLRVQPPPRTEPAVTVEQRTGVAAVFDLEGTIVSSNVVEAYLWLRLADLPRADWAAEIMDVVRTLPGYLSADRSDRGIFLRAFYRRYTGASADGVERMMAEQVGELLLRRVAPAAIRRIRRHRAAGHRTILITGAITAVTAPLHPLFDDVMATELAVDDAGRYTGYLAQPPLVGEARAAWLRRHAEATGLDLAHSYAYGDSHSDLPLLQAVGNPVAVNPDLGLYRVARRRRWVVERWPHDDGSPSFSLPTPVGAS